MLTQQDKRKEFLDWLGNVPTSIELDGRIMTLLDKRDLQNKLGTLDRQDARTFFACVKRLSSKLAIDADAPGAPSPTRVICKALAKVWQIPVTITLPMPVASSAQARADILRYISEANDAPMTDEEAHAYDARIAALRRNLDPLDTLAVEYAQTASLTGDPTGDDGEAVGSFDPEMLIDLLGDTFRAFDTIEATDHPHGHARLAYVRALAATRTVFSSAVASDINARFADIDALNDRLIHCHNKLVQADRDIASETLTHNLPPELLTGDFVKLKSDDPQREHVHHKLTIAVAELLTQFFHLRAARRVLAMLGRLDDPPTELICLLNRVRLGRLLTKEESQSFVTNSENIIQRMQGDDAETMTKAIVSSLEPVPDPLLPGQYDQACRPEKIRDAALQIEHPSLAGGTSRRMLRKQAPTPDIPPPSKWKPAPDAPLRVRDWLQSHEENRTKNPDHYRRVEALLTWMQGPFRLQRPDGSALHKLSAAKILGVDVATEAARKRITDLKPVPFVVTHDWAAAFANAQDYQAQIGDEYRLPFPACAFEFRISGRRVILLLSGDDSSSPQWQTAALCIMLDEANWYAESFTPSGHAINSENRIAFNDLLSEQVRAICIALEAEVAETELVSAPAKLNKQREKKGKTLLKDYHIVRLHSRRRAARAARDARGQEPTHRKRMHLRRGHWRHYELADESACHHVWQSPESDPTERGYCAACAAYRLWIKWMLVGNPDLGFIDKHYTL